MKIKHPWNGLYRNLFPVCFISLLLTSGCVYGPKEGSGINIIQAPSVSLNKYKIVAVEVSDDFNTGNPVSANTQLAGFIAAGLHQSGKFDKVYSTAFTVEHDADLRLSVVLTKSEDLVNHFDITYIGGPLSGRHVWDVKYGRALAALVRVIDARDGKTITSADIRSRTIIGGVVVTTDTDTVKILGDAIVRFVTSN
jgi:hypothetical protein